MRKQRRTRRRAQSGYISVSPFVDRKVFEYTINLFNSPFLKQRSANVIEFLQALLGEEEIERVFKTGLYGDDSLAEESLDENFDRYAPTDFSDLKTVYPTSKIVKFLKAKILPMLKRHHEELNRKSETDKRLDALKRIFRLTPADLEIISFKFAVTQSSALDDALEGNIVNFSEKSAFLAHAWKILNIPRSQIFKSLRDGNLVKCQLIDLERCFRMPDWVADYLSGLDTNLNKTFFSKMTEATLPLENHLVNKTELAVLKQFLEAPGGRNLLFYGKPGTGKTELAKSLAGHARKELYLINNKEEDNEGSQAMKTSIIAACNILDPKTSVILVDEADDLLNTQCSFIFSGERNSKSWINQFLDQSRHKVIWVTNRSTEIEPSTMRRFAFSLKFKQFNFRKKLQVFNYCLGKKGLQGFFTDEEIQSFCRRYSINAGGIVNALDNLKIRRNSRKAGIIEKLDTLLKNHETAITGREHKGNRMKDLGHYNLGALNTSENLEDVLAVTEKFLDRQSKSDGDRRINLNILLYGLPGSGKTEFVKYLGKKLKKEIVLKRASDLISCWVGETEKNIAEAFDEAEGGQSILFLDEADSFLNPRENATRSWEKTAVNELLTQMENFNGVLVCATNFLKGLDPAALRRFKFKIEFLPLTPEGNLEIYRTILQPLLKGKTLSSGEEREIKSMTNLTPGDFHVVAGKFSYVDRPVTHQALISSLINEAQFKPKCATIGFRR